MRGSPGRRSLTTLAFAGVVAAACGDAATSRPAAATTGESTTTVVSDPGSTSSGQSTLVVSTGSSDGTRGSSGGTSSSSGSSSSGEPPPSAQLALDCRPLSPLSISGNSGEKPQSKVWAHDGSWWSVFASATAAPDPGVWVWRLEDDSWVATTQLSAAVDVRADVRSLGDALHVVLHGGAQEVRTLAYAAGAYAETTAPATPPWGATETAALDVDGVGMLWATAEAGGEILVASAAPPYTTFTAPVAIASGVAADDICGIAALPSGDVGVLWSEQNTERFGWRMHEAGAPIDLWSALEIPAQRSALEIGNGMADDHLNLAVTDDGSVYAAVKTSYDTAEVVRIALLVRQPDGVWDPLHEISDQGTRPIVIASEDHDAVVVLYTESEAGGDILMRQAPRSTLVFDPPVALGVEVTVNNPTSTKDPYSGDVVIAFAGGGDLHGARCDVVTR